MAIVVNLDVMLAKRKMRLNELACTVGISAPNLSILKTVRAKAIRFTTWTKFVAYWTANLGIFWNTVSKWSH